MSGFQRLYGEVHNWHLERGQLMFLAFLKVIFVILLCTPLVYIMIFFLTKLIEEVVAEIKHKAE